MSLRIVVASLIALSMGSALRFYGGPLEGLLRGVVADAFHGVGVILALSLVWRRSALWLIGGVTLALSWNHFLADASPSWWVESSLAPISKHVLGSGAGSRFVASLMGVIVGGGLVSVLRDRERSVRAVVVMFLGMSLGYVLVSLASRGGSYAWELDNLSAFRLYLACGGSLVLAGLAFMGRRRLALVGTIVVILDVLSLSTLYRSEVALGGMGQEGDASLTVVAFNVGYNLDRESEALDMVDAFEADVVFIQEIPEKWIESMRRELRRFEVCVAVTDREALNCVFLISTSRIDQVSSTRVLDMGDGVWDVPSLQVEMELDGRMVSFLGIHTLPPRIGEWGRAHQAQLEDVARWAASGGVRVVLGDLNATPFSHRFRTLCEDGELLDSTRGFGYQPTYVSSRRLISVRIPIDHVLHSKELTTRRREVLTQSCGSDHDAVAVELDWRSN